MNIYQGGPRVRDKVQRSVVDNSTEGAHENMVDFQGCGDVAPITQPQLSDSDDAGLIRVQGGAELCLSTETTE